MTARLRPTQGHLYLALSLALSFVAYFPVTRIYFISDDFVDMVNIENRGWLHFLVAPFGGHMIFTRNVEVIVMYALFGVRHPEAYGWLALLTHLLNVWLLFGIVRKATGSPALAALGGTLWGTCQVISDSIGWFSVYGQVLCTTFLLLLTDRVVARQVERGAVDGRTALKWGSLVLLAATCFGGGIALAVAFPVLVLILFDRKQLDRGALAIVLATPVVVILLYYGWHVVYDLYEPLPLDERLVQSRVLRAPGPALQMFGYLLAVSTTSLLRGYAFTAFGYPTVEWWIVISYWSVLWSAFVISGAEGRRRLIALALMGFAIYGAIALGRAGVYRFFGVKMLEAARTLRYHYAGSFPVALVFVLGLGELCRGRPRWLPEAALGLWVLGNGYFYSRNDWTLNTHDDCRAYVGNAIREIDARLDAAPEGDVYLPNEELPRYCTVFMGYDAIPGSAAIYLLFHPEESLRGRYPRFVEPERHAGKFDNPRNHRLSRLIVPP